MLQDGHTRAVAAHERVYARLNAIQFGKSAYTAEPFPPCVFDDGGIVLVIHPRMRIRLVSQEYPPETAKGEVGTQTYVKAHGLTRLGHEVHMLSRSADRQSHHRDDNGVRPMRVPAADEPAYTPWI